MLWILFDRRRSLDEDRWPSDKAFHQAKRAWLREHGIDPADQSAVLTVVVASKRAHARTYREVDALARMYWQEHRAREEFVPPFVAPWETGTPRSTTRCIARTVASPERRPKPRCSP